MLCGGRFAALCSFVQERDHNAENQQQYTVPDHLLNGEAERHRSDALQWYRNAGAAGRPNLKAAPFPVEKAADRTVTIYQFQSTETYDGQFKFDTSGLPADAIESTVDTGSPGDPVKRVTLNMDYEFEIVLRLVGDESDADPLDRN